MASRLLIALLALAAVPRAGAWQLGSVRYAGRSRAILRQPSGAVVMLEAFDLMPVVDCLKLDGMDAVQQCMDNIKPWMEITDDGELNFSLNAVNGFIGGSVGVVGTVVSTMLKKKEVKDRLKCSYCEGSGQILCGHCLGSGTLSVMGADGVLTSMQCPNCEGTGTVVCINCQGSGLSVPDEFLQVLGDEEVGFTEQDYIGLFDEAPFNPKAVGAKAGEVGSATATAAPPAAAPTAAARSNSAPNKEDYTGGLG